MHKVYIIWMLTFKTIVSRFDVYTVFSTKIVTTSEFNHPIRSMSYDHLQSVINSYYWHKHKGNGITSTAHTHICRLCSLLQGHQFGLRLCVKLLISNWDYILATIIVHSDDSSDFLSPIQYEVNTICDSRLILTSQNYAYANSRHILNMKLFK